MSQPVLLHAADRMGLAIDEMRQCVGSRRRDEGWLARALSALICHELLRILDILSDLLAQIRAGTLPLATVPPAVPMDTRSATPTNGETGDRRTTRAPHGPAGSTASSSHGADAPSGTRADPPADDLERGAAAAPRRAKSSRSPPRAAAPTKRRVSGHPSVVPRLPEAAFGSTDGTSMYVHFVPFSECSHSGVAAGTAG